MCGVGAGVGADAAGTEGSASAEGFSGVSFSSSVSNPDKESLSVSLFPLLWAASRSCDSCGALPQASSASGIAVGLTGGGSEGTGFAVGLLSGVIVGLSVEDSSS